jgi:hypothetical protein
MVTAMIRHLIPRDATDRSVAAYEVVNKLFTETEGLYVPMSLCAELIRLHNKDLDRSVFDIKRTQIDELCGLVGTKVESRASSGNLLGDSRLRSLLIFWSNFGNQRRLREWLTAEIEDPSHLLRFLRAIARQRDFPRNPLSQNPYMFILKDIETFISVDIVSDKVAAIDQRSLQVDDRFLVEALKWALEDHLRLNETSELCNEKHKLPEDFR